MIQGMTGFGAAEREGFRVEVRSLNHKYMDVSVKLPSVLMGQDIAIRNLLKERFARGKFDVTVSLTGRERVSVRLNRELARGIYSEFLELQRELGLPGSLGIDFLTRYRDILLSEEKSYDESALFEALEEALASLERMRKTEGATLAGDMLQRLGRLGDIRNEVESFAHQVPLRYQELLMKRIGELLSAATPSPDETRIAQEVAMLAQKADITEELDRLRLHIGQFSSLLSKGDVVGRRLDFVLQEMHRETNTIASKTDDIRIINLTIEARTEMEKLREQAQNIQ